MCRGPAWPEPTAAQAPGDRSRGRVARSYLRLPQLGYHRCELAHLRRAARAAIAAASAARAGARAAVGAATTTARAGARAAAGAVAMAVVVVVWRRPVAGAGTPARVDHARRVPRLGVGVRPGQVQVIAASVSRVSVPSN